VIHNNDDLFYAGDQIHRTTHPLDHLARDHPVRDVAILSDFHRAQNSQIDMTSADHGKTGRTVEIGRMRQLADGLLARINQVSIDFILIRERSNAQHAILALKSDMHAFRNVVCHQRGNANAKIDIITIL